MKKLLLLLVVAVCLFALCACGEKAPEKVPEEQVTPVEETKPEETVSGEKEEVVVTQSGEPEVTITFSGDFADTDTIISDLLSSEEYKKKSEKDKKVAVENMLNELVLRKEIKNLSYDEDGKLFSFEYKNGVLGGISLKDLDDKTN